MYLDIVYFDLSDLKCGDMFCVRDTWMVLCSNPRDIFTVKYINTNSGVARIRNLRNDYTATLELSSFVNEIIPVIHSKHATYTA